MQSVHHKYVGLDGGVVVAAESDFCLFLSMTVSLPPYLSKTEKSRVPQSSYLLSGTPFLGSMLICRGAVFRHTSYQRRAGYASQQMPNLEHVDLAQIPQPQPCGRGSGNMLVGADPTGIEGETVLWQRIGLGSNPDRYLPSKLLKQGELNTQQAFFKRWRLMLVRTNSEFGRLCGSQEPTKCTPLQIHTPEETTNTSFTILANAKQALEATDIVANGQTLV